MNIMKINYISLNDNNENLTMNRIGEDIEELTSTEDFLIKFKDRFNYFSSSKDRYKEDFKIIYQALIKLYSNSNEITSEKESFKSNQKTIDQSLKKEIKRSFVLNSQFFLSVIIFNNFKIPDDIFQTICKYLNNCYSKNKTLKALVSSISKEYIQQIIKKEKISFQDRFTSTKSKHAVWKRNLLNSLKSIDKRYVINSKFNVAYPYVVNCLFEVYLKVNNIIIVDESTPRYYEIANYFTENLNKYEDFCYELSHASKPLLNLFIASEPTLKSTSSNNKFLLQEKAVDKIIENIRSPELMKSSINKIKRGINIDNRNNKKQKTNK